MLNFAEQTGSGAVIVVWSFLITRSILCKINAHNRVKPKQQKQQKNKNSAQAQRPNQRQNQDNKSKKPKLTRHAEFIRICFFQGWPTIDF
jgi:hypothetical protein